MSNVAMSVASLVKNNNGLFKSEKQAKFILETQDDMVIAFDKIYGNKCDMYYMLDSKGVFKVVKDTEKNPMQVVWTRLSDSAWKVESAKRQAKLEKNLNNEKLTEEASSLVSKLHAKKYQLVELVMNDDSLIPKFKKVNALLSKAELRLNRRTETMQIG